jgi:large repetitive protein
VPYDLALYDLISPYVLRGDTFGQWHAALSVLYVAEHSVTADDGGIVIRGIARFNGDVSPYIDPSKMTFGVNAENTDGHPANDPGRRDPWIDVRDAHIDFELSAPRVASQKVATAVTAIGNAGSFKNAGAVLTAYDTNVNDPPPSDYASTEFTLDLLLTTVVLRPPFLQGAKLDPSGILIDDPTNKQVKITLPKIKVRLTQGSAVTDPLRATLLSLGAAGLDDRDDFGVAQLITMDPPYAFIGASKVVGIGFRTATLDLSDGSTPPDVLSQFGYDDSWTGLYLPELRLYIAPHGAEDLAFDASATNLLIGIGASAGVTGDFELAVVDQGSGEVKLSARFYDDNGRSFGITKAGDGTATVQLPQKTRMTIDIDGGLTPYVSSATIGTGSDTPGRLFDVDFGSDTKLTIVIKGKGSQPSATQQTLTITASKQPANATPPPGTSPQADNPGAKVSTTSMTKGGDTQQTPLLKIVSQTTTQAIVSLDTPSTQLPQTHWTVGGADKGVSATVTVDVGQGDTVNVQAVLPGDKNKGSFLAFYRFDHPSPPPHPEDPVSYTVPPENTHSTQAPDQGTNTPWQGGHPVSDFLTDVPNGAHITIKGFASYEAGDQTSSTSYDYKYNNQLALNRAHGLQAIMQRYAGKTFQYDSVDADMTNWVNQGPQNRNQYWVAQASWTPADTADTTIIGSVTRAKADPPIPPPIPDNPQNAPVPKPPSWFKKIDIKVRIVRDHFVACEVSGKFDIQTPTENQLATGGVNSAIPQWGDVGSQNPADGIIDVRVVVQIDDATDIVTVSGYFGADPADKDGLKMIGWLPPGPDSLPVLSDAQKYGQNFLGLGIAFWPLLATAAGAAANDGAAVELAVDGAGFLALGIMAALPWFNVERIIWYGGEFDVQVRPDGFEVLILVDIETAISADISIGGFTILTIPRKKPLTVRYKAIGFIIGNPPGQTQFPFRPYFDSSKGYTIDVSGPGAIQIASPFDKLIKILGARLSRNNPFLVEVDLGFAIDLGVVTIERARIRLNLNPGGPPELTAFAASVDIPGAIRGRGSIEMGSDGSGNTVVAGSLDLTIVPVEVRIAATLQIAQIPPANGGPATGVKVTLEVDFPVAIVLGCSGLGIYGFIGLFAVNYARDESKIPPADQKAMAPALGWLKATGGDPTNNAYWTPKVNSWAFGVGALLGTEGSDIIFNLKGMIILELPGPRLLLMMKAKLLIPPPALASSAEGLFLAVIDLDFGRGTLTIGLEIDFDVDPLLTIKIPVEAFFDFNDLSDWHVYLGQFSNMIQATVLSVFDASGYLMLSGKGIAAHPAGIEGHTLPAVTGFSIAVGLHVSFTWGGGPLYAQLAAGFDAVVGFSPFRMAGILSVRGTLHLFIIDISAWAELDVDVGDDGMGGHIAQISGDICGKIEFLFFSISGCVSFSLGGDSVPAPPAPPLVKSMKMVSRSPAIVQGTGVDKKIDCSLGDAVENDVAQPGGGMPVVPVDALPAVMMAMPPLQDPSLTFQGQAIGGTPQAPADGWVQRGDMYYQYTLKKVELIGPLSAGKTPAVWWNSKAGDQALEAQLALLSWVPDPTPKAVGSSKYLDETTKEKWGTICQPAAPPAPIFWTFFFQILGPSDFGWTPLGLAYPDPPNVVRSEPPDMYLKVTERWRSGDPQIDAMRAIVPAEIEGAAVQCPSPTAPTPGAPSPTAPTPGAPIPGAPIPGVPTKPSIPAPGRSTISTRSLVQLGAAGDVAVMPPPTVARDPIQAIRGSARQVIDPSVKLTVADFVSKLAGGQPVSRSAMSSLSVARPSQAAPPPCFGWCLASPVFDDGKIVAFGDPQFGTKIQKYWAAQNYVPGPLDDAVVFDFGGEFAYARFYMWVPERFLANVVVVAASDAKDNLSNQHLVVPADKVPPAVLPTTWTGATSPWQPAVFVLEELSATATNYVAVFVEVKGSPGATRVQIGCTPASRGIRSQLAFRPFFVGGIEALKSSEVSRSSYDNTEQSKKQSVLDNALGLDSADNALLAAGQTYQVKLTWSALSQQKTPGKDPSAVTTVPDTAQSFWFQTDTNPPAKLDSWILVALPGEAEKHFFVADPVKVVFATNNVALVYDTYGKKLQARLRPSSFVPVVPPAGVTHPIPLSPANLKPVKGSALSPWENAVQKLVAVDNTGLDINGKPPALPCVSSSGQRIRHSVLTIPITLDLYTDYLIDIEMLDKGAADGSPGVLVWRGSFSTGGFQTEADFASSFQISKLNHRGVHPDDVGKLQAIGPKYAAQDPQGNQFDTELTTAGVDALPVPKYPGFTVFWEPGAPDPQPVAILVDSSEPMWRERPIPTQMTDSGPSAAQWYELDSQPWLELQQEPGGDNIVDHIVMAPGGQRALVTLKAGSRGKHILLALERVPHLEPYLDGPAAVPQYFTILDTVLRAAPWEETD